MIIKKMIISMTVVLRKTLEAVSHLLSKVKLEDDT